MLVALLLGLAFVVASEGQLTLNHDYTGGGGMTPSSLIQQKEARGPNRYEYTVNMLVGLNSSMSLSTLNQSRSILWALTQRLTNSSVASIPIFSIANSAIRQDPFIRSTFKCAPNETDCNSITVNPIRLQSIGDYSYQSFINTLDSLIVDYNVSTWVHPLDMQCGLSSANGVNGVNDLGVNQTACAANKTQGVISVLGSSRVTVSCSILVAQNDQYDPNADLVIRSVEDNTDCSDTDSTQVRLIPPVMAQTILNPLLNVGGSGSAQQPVNTALYRLTRNCTRIFTKASLNTRLTCQLQPRIGNQLPVELQPSSPYTTLTMTLDVQYAPEYSAPPSQQFNRTMIVNSSASATPVFTCPFDSNPPPQFEWRVSLVVINRTDSAPPRRRLDITEFLTAGKDYIIPRDLEVGLYGFECRAKTLGLVNKYSDTVKFYLSVIPVPVSSKKGSNTNVGAIIGGVIGGVLAIAVIVLLVLFLIRRHRNGLKDESEKAKELDIGLNENNPHLSSRSNLSTAGLTAATATTTSSSSSSTSSNNVPAAVVANGGGGVGGTVTSNGNVTGTKSGAIIGHKAIAGLMVPSSTAQSYAAIAHAAAAAAAQQNRNQQQFNQDICVVGNNNTMYQQQQQQQQQQQNLLKSTAQSYNNPGFFESTASYAIQPQSHLESPPPYDSALHHQQQQQSAAKKDPQQQQQQQMMLQSQQKDYMGSNSRLLGGSGSNTPTLIQKNPNIGLGVGTGVPQSHSYSHQLGGPSSTPVVGGSLQQMQYNPGSQTALQYTTVQQTARNRQPLNGSTSGGADMVDQSAAATQYTTMAQLNPIDV